MSIRVESKVLPKELADLQAQARRDLAIKTLSALAVLVMGIGAIILLNSNFLAIGVAIILVSSLAIHQYFYHYLTMQNMISKAASALRQSLTLRD